MPPTPDQQNPISDPTPASSSRRSIWFYVGWTALILSIVGVIAYVGRVFLVVPIFFSFFIAMMGLGVVNQVSFDTQYKQLQASLPVPQMVAVYKCDGSNGDLEWQIWSVSAVDPGNSNPEVGIPPSVYTEPEFKLTYNNQLLFDTGGTRAIAISGGQQNLGSSSVEIQSTKTALTTIGNFVIATSSDAQAGIRLMRECLISHESDIAPLVQFYNFGNVLQLEFRTSAPAGRAVGTKNNFPKTISIPGPGLSTPVFLTVLPGQSAMGTLDGQQVEFRVDKATAPDVPPAYHILVNGQEDTSSYVGKIMVQVGTQYGDGSVLWDIFYQ